MEPDCELRWPDTMAKNIAFTEPPLRDYLSPEDLEMLLKVHPDSKARFWGAPAHYDSEIGRLATGDPILTTGLGCPDAVGWFGCELQETTPWLMRYGNAIVSSATGALSTACWTWYPKKKS